MENRILSMPDDKYNAILDATYCYPTFSFAANNDDSKLLITKVFLPFCLYFISGACELNVFVYETFALPIGTLNLLT